MPNESGYFNQFDPSDDYYEVRARAGYVQQSREVNELQSIIKGLVKGNFDTIYRNGSLVRGNLPVPDTANPNILNMSDAEVYYNGIVHTVPATQVTLTGIGAETVGVLFTESVVDYVADSTLRDPAAGFQNYGMPGASRLKITKQWINSTSNANAIPVYNFLDGHLAKLPESGQIDIITQTLARRTFDESGNYTVDGFDISLEDKDSGQFNAVVGNTSSTGTSSKAYVQGREIIKLLPERIAIDKAFGFRTFDLDQVQYDASSNQMRLAEDRVKRITKVTAEFRVNNKAVTHGGSGSSDTFINAGEALREIYAVKNTSGGSTAYTSGTDYIRTGNTINWSPVGSEPSIGSTYYVDYRYARDLVAGEYTLVVDPTTGASYLDITSLTPKPDLTNGPAAIDVSYEFYLARVDVLYLKPDGKIDVIAGDSEKSAVAKPVPVNMLGLCEILVPAGGSASQSTVTKYDNKRFTMEDFHKILTRLERAEYNQAIKDLDGNAQQYAAASVNTLSGILTEGFTYTANDINTDGVGSISKIKFDKGLSSTRIIDVAAQELVLPEVQSTSALAVVDNSSSIRKYNHVATMTTASETNALISQPIASSFVTLNPYGTSLGAPTIFIASSVDNETETDSVITANNGLSAVSPLVQTRELFPYGNLNADLDRNLRQYNDKLKTFVKSSKVVYVRGFGYPASALLKASFDNVPVSLTPITSSVGLPLGMSLPSGGNTTSSVDGKVQCNASGQFLATFTVPVGIASGVKAIVVSDASGNTAAATFEGRGLNKVQTDSSLRRQIEIRDAAAPVVSTFNISSTNISSGSTVVLSGTYTGLATNVVLRTSDGVLKRAAITQSSTNYSITSDAITSGVDYAMYLEGPGGVSDSQTGTIQVGSVGPSGGAPTATLYRPQLDTSNNGVTKLTLDWVFSGAVTKITLAYSNNQIAVKTAGVTLTNLDPSGQVVIDIYQTGTLTMIASGAGGNSEIRTTQVTINRDVPVRTLAAKDLIAQSFTLKRPAVISEVEVFFKTKSTTSTVSLEIRDVVNGLPGTKILASKLLDPAVDTINTSSDGSSGTRFILEDAAWLDIDTSTGFKQYCFVLSSDSPSYQLWVAKVTETSVGASPALISAQAYSEGALFTSSNSLWSPVLDTDSKFILKNATFNQSAGNTLTFNSISTSNCTGMFLKADTLHQDSIDSVSWQYQLNGNTGWLSFTPGSYIDFKVVATQIDIKATLAGSGTTSPVIDHSTATVKLLFRQSFGEYITKRATFIQAYNTVRVVTRALVPNQCSLRVFFTDETSGSGPGGFTWTEITSGWTATTLPDGKYSEKDNNPGSSLTTSLTRKFFRFRVRLETTDITLTPRVRSIMSIVNA